MFKGLGISPGLSCAKILILEKQELNIPEHNITDIEAEIKKFKDAHKKTIDENNVLYDEACKKLSPEDANIFLAHKDILEDEYSLVNPIIEYIQCRHWNATKAVNVQFSHLISMLESMDDEYMRARALDIRDICKRLLSNLLNIKEPDLSCLQEETIIVAKEITPSDTARMNFDKIVGFISEYGGITSHSAIIARNMEIPAVSQIPNILQVLHNDLLVILDGTNGTIDTDITEEKLLKYQSKKQKELTDKAQYHIYRDKPTITADGHRLYLYANIGSPSEVKHALKNGAEGIGLFRSEFLYMNCKTLPDEETQFNAYKSVLQQMNPKPVIIRTLDIGGDKELTSLALPKEENPFLGYRAIRICLDNADLFQTQLRALLRAGIYGNLKIMFPMISCLEELRRAKEIVSLVIQNLKNENILFQENVPIGMMIEVPGAAIMADTFAKEVDFFSIGTNDLTQYTLAADRGNSKVSHLFNPSHPAVLKLIKETIRAAHKNKIECGICGEAGGDPKLQPLFIEYGIDELSMSPSSILKSRMFINQLRINSRAN